MESDYEFLHRLIKQGELLGLIERHGWSVAPRSDGHAYIVHSWPRHAAGHVAPTLIEALTEASRCNRCTEKKET